MDEVLGSSFPGKRCLVLIDIEDSEKTMLDGALALLSKQPKPIRMVKIATAEHQPKGGAINPNFAATFQIFWDRGCEAWPPTRQSRRIFPEDVERIVRREQYALTYTQFPVCRRGARYLAEACVPIPNESPPFCALLRTKTAVKERSDWQRVFRGINAAATGVITVS